MKQKIRTVHGICLVALFVMGNTLIRYPWKESAQHPWLGLLLSATGALLSVTLLCPFFRWLLRGGLCHRPIKRKVAGAVALLLGGYSLFCAYTVFSDYVVYAMEAVLPEGRRLILAALFLFVATWLSATSRRGIDLASLVCFVGVFFCIFLLFVFGARHYRPEYLFDSFRNVSFESFKTAPGLLWEALLPLIPLSAYVSLSVPKKGGRMLAVGTALGYAMLLLCVLQTLCTFGAYYAAEQAYPYSYAVRVISIGPYFFRLEGFSYLTEFTSCLIRTSICLALPARLLGRFFPRIGRLVPPVVAAMIFLRFVFF